MLIQGLNKQHHVIVGDSTSADAIDLASSTINARSLSAAKRRAYQRGDNESVFDVIIIDPPYNLPDLYSLSINPPSVGQRLIVFYDPPRCGAAIHAAMLAGWCHQFEFVWDLRASIRAYPNEPLRGHKACSVFSAEPRMKWDLSAGRIARDGRRGFLKSVESIANQSLDSGHGKPLEWLRAIYGVVGGDRYIDKFVGPFLSSLVACDANGQSCAGVDVNHYDSWDSITWEK